MPFIPAITGNVKRVVRLAHGPQRLRQPCIYRDCATSRGFYFQRTTEIQPFNEKAESVSPPHPAVKNFLPISLIVLWAALPVDLYAAAQTQSITLVPGWNAVWLEVEPQDANGKAQSPETVFAAQPAVDVVARYLPANNRMQFIQDPTTEALGADFWLKWRRNTVIGGNTLGGIVGNAPYLIHNNTEQAVPLNLTGEVAFHRYRWTPDSYNFFGVPVGNTAPTFTEFFGASAAHPLTQIFKLSAGKWVAVQPGERMQKGAAYWVFAKGGSSYQGPVPVVFSDSDGFLAFGENLTTSELSAGNLAATPSSLTINRLTNGGLSLKNAITGNEIVNSAITGAIAPRSTASVRLQATRPLTAATGTLENLYRLDAALASGSSYYQYLPVRASLAVDAPGSGGSALAGLWVGDVLLAQATSLVEGKAAGASRLEGVRRPMRFRVILHVDAGGQASLLEHATIMQKARASAELTVEQVVVVDDTKIPGLVGIETRGGKLVGKRFDTAAYDLPRSPIAESEPSAVPQTYLLTLPLSGALAPGGVVTTPPGTFVIDPWHRTHPYRHVFNPEHRKGFRITREMRFEIDPAGSPEAGQIPGYGTSALSGIFEESITGLLKPGDVNRARGRFILQRVSATAELE